MSLVRAVGVEPEGQTGAGVGAAKDTVEDVRRRAVRWASYTVIGATACLLAGVLWRTGGTFVYVLDDPAIHLAVARRLVFDGTWGVVAGQYQSASSSPLWTSLLAPTQLIARGRSGEVVPLVLNVAAGLGVVRLLAPDLARACERSRRWVVAIVAGVVVVGPLSVPALAFVGMEHTLHMALVLAAALAVERRWVTPTGPRSSRATQAAPFVLVALATLTRGESAFVAVGLACALVAVGLPSLADPDRPPASWSSRRLAIVGLGASAAGALALIGAVNLAFGQEVLPNSVMLKTFGDRGDTRRSVGAALDRLATDPWLVLVFVVAVAVVVAVRRRGFARPALFPAVVVLVTVMLHVELGAVDSSLRYEAYINGLGTWLVLRAAPHVTWSGASRLPRLTAAAVVLLVAPIAALQVKNTVAVPKHAGITWEQRYQVARFLGRAYPHDPIAIGELGYISLYHDGPLTDVYGIGDHDVLEATLDGRKGPALWRKLQRDRSFRVVATYSFTMAGRVPEEWFPVAQWHSPDAYFEDTQFWATVPEEVEPLLRQLRAFEDDLPDSVEVTYNELVGFAAAARAREQ